MRYEVITAGPEGTRVEATYDTRAEAEQHAERLRRAGCYAAVNEVE